MRSGVLCRSLVQPRAFHRSTPLASALPKEHRCEYQLARAAPSTRPLRSAKFATQNTFNWFDPDFAVRSSRASFRRFVLSASRPGHPIHGFQLPALPRFVPVAESSYPSLRLPRAEARRSLHSEKMPLTNLCNQLIVTGTRRTPQLSSFGLTPVFRPLPASGTEPTLTCEVATRRRPRPRWFAASGIPNLER